jgi:hypothetical protein
MYITVAKLEGVRNMKARRQSLLILMRVWNWQRTFHISPSGFPTTAETLNAQRRKKDCLMLRVGSWLPDPPPPGPAFAIPNYCECEVYVKVQSVLVIIIFIIINLLWRVMPLKTPFLLVIHFITILQVVTTITFYTGTYLHNYTPIYTPIQSHCHLNSLQLFFTYELPVTVSYRELLCSADGLQDNTSARTPRKTVAPLLKVRLSSRCIAMVTARIHRKPVT